MAVQWPSLRGFHRLFCGSMFAPFCVLCCMQFALCFRVSVCLCVCCCFVVCMCVCVRAPPWPRLPSSFFCLLPCAAFLLPHARCSSLKFQLVGPVESDVYELRRACRVGRVSSGSCVSECGVLCVCSADVPCVLCVRVSSLPRPHLLSFASFLVPPSPTPLPIARV